MHDSFSRYDENVAWRVYNEFIVIFLSIKYMINIMHDCIEYNKKRIPTVSFDLTTPELDNHPIIRTMLNVNCAWSIGLFRRCLGPGALPLKLCRLY